MDRGKVWLHYHCSKCDREMNAEVRFDVPERLIQTCPRCGTEHSWQIINDKAEED